MPAQPSHEFFTGVSFNRPVCGIRFPPKFMSFKQAVFMMANKVFKAVFFIQVIYQPYIGFQLGPGKG